MNAGGRLYYSAKKRGKARSAGAGASPYQPSRKNPKSLWPRLSRHSKLREAEQSRAMMAQGHSPALAWFHYVSSRMVELEPLALTSRT